MIKMMPKLMKAIIGSCPVDIHLTQNNFDIAKNVISTIDTEVTIFSKQFCQSKKLKKPESDNNIQL